MVICALKPWRMLLVSHFSIISFALSVTQDLEERARLMKMKMSAYRSGGSPAMSDTESYLGRVSDRSSRSRSHEPRGSAGTRFDRYDRGHELDRGHHRRGRREYSKSWFFFCFFRSLKKFLLVRGSFYVATGPSVADFE